MRLSTLRAVPVAFAVLAVVATACTGGNATSSTTSSSAEPTAPPTVDQGDVAFAPGEFAYQLHGVKATLSWNGGDGQLTVTNGSGRELGQPSLYAVTQRQERVDATVEGAAPIPDGQEVTLVVTFPASLTLDDVGIVALVFGDENWGAFAPVPAS